MFNHSFCSDSDLAALPQCRPTVSAYLFSKGRAAILGCGFWRLGYCAAALLVANACLRATATDLQITNLPPPAAKAINFDQDIRPILEQSCLRCHGSERPKSHFSLVTREQALKGGDDNSDDIVPGNSQGSKLVQYVAGLVPDMKMPPSGKAEPLTPAQIGLVRAWIDQGASWSASNAFPQTTASMSPTVRVIDVQGATSKFRELEGVPGGWAGGGEEFFFEERSAPDTKTTVEGRVLVPDQDFELKLDQTKTDFGFIRGGVDQWRRYYSDQGGFYPGLGPGSFSLNEDLHLDIGRAWMEVGLTLPHLPQVVLGYEYDYKDGAKSMLEWGDVGGADGKHIYPAAKNIFEGTQIIKLDVTYDLAGWLLEDRARVEFYRDKNFDQEITGYTLGAGPDAFIHTREDYSHVMGANTFRFEKQIKDWWRASGGYLYSRLDGSSSLNQMTVDAMNVPVTGNFWRDQVTLQRETHAFSLASIFLPLEGLSASVGTQVEFSRQEGFGNIDLDTGDPSVPSLFLLEPAVVRSDYQETRTSENLNLRYTKIPFTVLFAEGSFQQDSISEFDEEAGSTPDVFLRDTDYFNNTLDYRAGFDTSPWRWMSLNAHYRRSDSESDYNNLQDESPLGGLGYPAFIKNRDIATDEVQTRLVLHPSPWLKATLTYQWSQSDFSTSTDPVVTPALGDISPGGPILSGVSRAQTWGLGTVFMPSRRFYFSGSFTYSDTETTTAANGLAAVAPYKGNAFSFIANANYSVNQRTGLQLTYSFSKANYGQNNLSGLPLGLDYTQNALMVGVTRKLTKALSSSLRYRYYNYGESNMGGFNNFTAHGVFLTLTLRWM